MYDRILLPTDGSAEMGPVIDHAMALAAHHDATIHALYVIDTAAFGSLPMDTSADAMASMLEEEGQAALDAVAEAGEGVDIERALVDGSPSSQITAYASEHDIDVIVMGTHGRGGIDRLLLGSVAERVVRTAEVPVVTVRVGQQD